MTMRELVLTKEQYKITEVKTLLKYWSMVMGLNCEVGLKHCTLLDISEKIAGQINDIIK